MEIFAWIAAVLLASSFILVPAYLWRNSGKDECWAQCPRSEEVFPVETILPMRVRVDGVSVPVTVHSDFKPKQFDPERGSSHVGD